MFYTLFVSLGGESWMPLADDGTGHVLALPETEVLERAGKHMRLDLGVKIMPAQPGSVYLAKCSCGHEMRVAFDESLPRLLTNEPNYFSENPCVMCKVRAIPD